MAINFDSIISNTKGAANIAKIKVTLGLKVNELSKLYAEVGKLFYEVTRNNNAQDNDSLKEDKLSLDIDNMNSFVSDLMENEELRGYLEKITDLKKEIEELESQVLVEKGNMRPIDTSSEQTNQDNTQANYYQNDVNSSESVTKCPKCGNEIKEGASFCPKCGTKVARNQENFQQNNYKSQNYGQKPHIDKKSLFTKQSVGLIVGILLMAYGAMDVSFGELIGLVIAGVGAVIMFYTKS